MTPAEPGLREAVRAVFADYDEPPTEKYLDQAVIKFRAAYVAAPQPALDVERLASALEHVNVPIPWPHERNAQAVAIAAEYERLGGEG